MNKEEIVRSAVHSEDVLFSWTQVTCDLDDESLAKKLLQ